MSKVGQLSKVSKHFLSESVVITSDIWDRDKDYPKQFLPHVGYDYRAKIGTPVYAPFDGEIVQATQNLGSSYGRQVYVFNGIHTFHTAHYSKIDVKQGQGVKKGDLLGLSGASGASENTYDPHLHAGLAKGRITNAGNKGSFLGDVWVDLEEVNFDKPLLSNDEVAKEVLQGKWGNGTKRINALKGAGYNPSEVQQLVNQLSKSNLNKPVEKPKPNPVPKPKQPVKNKPSGSWKAEDGVFILSSNIYERNQPKTSDKSGMRLITKGKRYPYDAYQVAGGYVWLRNKDTGKVIPWRVHNGEVWGKVV